MQFLCHIKLRDFVPKPDKNWKTFIESEIEDFSLLLAVPRKQ